MSDLSFEIAAYVDSGPVNAHFLELLACEPQRPHELGLRRLEEPEHSRVVDPARGVGVHPAHAYLVMVLFV